MDEKEHGGNSSCLRLVVEKVFNGAFLAVIIVLTAAVALLNGATYEVQTMWQLAMMLVVLLFAVLVVWLYRKILQHHTLKTFFENKYSLVVVLIMAVLFVLQLYMVVNIYMPIGWDTQWTVEAAISETAYGRWDYFSVSPNNLFLTAFQRLFFHAFKLFGLEDPWLVLSLVGVILVDLAIVMLFWAVKIAYRLQTAYAALFCSVLLFGLSPWQVVPYSDIYSMPFVAGIFLMYVLWMRPRKRTAEALPYAAAGGALTGMAFLLKPHNIAIVIAIIIIHLLRMDRKALFKTAVSLVASLSVAVGCYALFQVYIQNQNYVQIVPGYAYPVQHYVNIGLTSDETRGAHGYYGGYSAEEVGKIQHLGSTKAMREASNARIREKLTAMGPLGYGMFLMKKARWIFSEGYFFWGLEDGFADWGWREPNVLTSFFYPSGRNFNLYLYAAQGVWLCMLLFISVASVKKVRQRRGSRYTSILQCAVFGLLLLLLLLEGRSRYLVGYLPVFAMLAAVGLEEVVRFAAGMLKRKRAVETVPGAV